MQEHMLLHTRQSFTDSYLQDYTEVHGQQNIKEPKRYSNKGYLYIFDGVVSNTSQPPVCIHCTLP